MNDLANITPEYDDAVVQLLRDIGLAADSENQPDKIEHRVLAIVSGLADLFSLQEPTLSDDLDETLRLIARDIHLSNIMRERALYRLYMVVTTVKELDGATVPMWYGTVNDDGNMITSQEDFIRLFTKKSGIGRASAFRRIRVYNQLATFGISGQDAWLRVLEMPYTIQELMEGIALWNRSEFVGINMEVARSIAGKVMPDVLDDLNDAIDNTDMDTALAVYAPVVRKMLSEMDNYQDAKEALDHIKHDILGTPTVTYKWDSVTESIVAVTTVPIIENGQIVSESRSEIYVFVDSVDPPPALMADLFKRLPITNRHELPN